MAQQSVIECISHFAFGKIINALICTS